MNFKIIMLMSLPFMLKGDNAKSTLNDIQHTIIVNTVIAVAIVVM